MRSGGEFSGGALLAARSPPARVVLTHHTNPVGSTSRSWHRERPNERNRPLPALRSSAYALLLGVPEQAPLPCSTSHYTPTQDIVKLFFSSPKKGLYRGLRRQLTRYILSCSIWKRSLRAFLLPSEARGVCKYACALPSKRRQHGVKSPLLP